MILIEIHPVCQSKYDRLRADWFFAYRIFIERLTCGRMELFECFVRPEFR